MEQVDTDFKLVTECYESSLRDVGITIVVLIPLRVFLHRLLKSRSNTYVIDNQAALFILEDTVDPCNSLHEIVSCHRLENIHCRKRGDIESCEPHIDNNGNLHRIVIVLELLCQLFL